VLPVNATVKCAPGARLRPRPAPPIRWACHWPTSLRAFRWRCSSASGDQARIAESRSMRIQPGEPYPLGATWDGLGVNFAIFSEFATAVDLCLFDSPDAVSETHRIRMPEQTDLVWHCRIPGCRPGQ